MLKSETKRIVKGRIKDLIVERQKCDSLPNYKKGVLDTLVEFYDIECFDDDKSSVWNEAHKELGIDLISKRKQQLSIIKTKTEIKIKRLKELHPEMDDFLTIIENQCYKSIGNINPHKKRHTLQVDMQNLKKNINGMFRLTEKYVMGDEKC